MAWRWLSPQLDGRTNAGVKRSWFFSSEDEAKAGACKEAHRKPVAPELVPTLWRSLERAGWSVEEVDPRTADRI